MHKLVEQFRHSTRDRHKNGPPTARYSEDQRQIAVRSIPLREAKRLLEPPSLVPANRVRWV